jgi:hypothetical protein
MDRKGICVNCRRSLLPKLPQRGESYRCVFCGCPFPAGKVHQRCMRLMGTRAARGKGAPSYWEAKWYTKKGMRMRTR